MDVLRDIFDQILDIVLVNPGITMIDLYSRMRQPCKFNRYELECIFVRYYTLRPKWLRMMRHSNGVSFYVIDDEKYQKDTMRPSKGAAEVNEMLQNGKLKEYGPRNEDPVAEAERRGNFLHAQKISYDSFRGVQLRRPDPLRQAEMDQEQEALDNRN